MAASKAYSGQGMLVEIGVNNAVLVDADADTFIEVGEVGNVTPPSPTRSTIDVTHLRSTIMEFIAGLIDAGEGTLNCNNINDDTGQVECRTALEQGQLRNFRFTFPTQLQPARLDVKCLVIGLPQTSNVNEALKLTINLKASSLYEWSNT